VLAGASACTCGEGVLSVTVEIAPLAGATRCVTVAAQQGDGGQEVSSGPIPRPPEQDALAVAVYQGELPDQISLVARGYGDPSCLLQNEESAPGAASFAPGQPDQVTLRLGSGFPYVPSNFDPGEVAGDGGVAGRVSLSCAAWFDSTDGGLSWCSGQPLPTVRVVNQAGGPDAVVLAMRRLDVSGSLALVGSRPVILAVYGDVTVAGTISARSGTGVAAGAGSNPAGLCNAGDGLAAGGSAGTGSGGGGGGYGLPGGGGGALTGTGGVPGGTAGGATGNAEIVPLRGGCSGGEGGRPNDIGATGGHGGVGGGAVQISAAGLLQFTGSGTVTASGAGGQGGLEDRTGDGSGGGNGGGGGGSGGAVLLEGQDVLIPSTTRLTASGGGGGESGSWSIIGTIGDPGGDGPTTTGNGGTAGGGATICSDGAAGGSAAGGAGTGVSTPYISGDCGAGGGGGSVGRIRVNGSRNCQVDAGVMSPPSTFGGICP